MKDIVRTLDYYGFDDDNTMVKKNENYKDETFQITKVVEQQNRKYIKLDTVSEENNEEENTVDNG
jgi:hypothetical protein